MDYLTLKYIYIQFFISKRPASLIRKSKLTAGGQTPRPLADCPAKKASFFLVLPWLGSGHGYRTGAALKQTLLYDLCKQDVPNRNTQ